MKEMILVVEDNADMTAALKLALEMSERLPEDAIRASLEEPLSLVDQLLTQVRDLSLRLRPAMLDDLGLLPALLWQFERYTAQTRVQVRFQHSGLAKRRLGSKVETAAYRIVQEALTNVARHARVEEVAVRIWITGDTLHIGIEDRGAGFDPEKTRRRVTGGLIGMRERAALLRGQLTVEAAPGAGTRLMVQLPLGDARDRGMMGVHE